MDVAAIIKRLLPRWKLIFAMPVLTLLATYGVLKVVPRVYQATVEILVFDPHRQVDSAVQGPVSELDINGEAINTEFEIIKSRSLMLRVVKELHLDKDPEFQPRERFSALTTLLQRSGLIHGSRPDAIPDRAEYAAAVLGKDLQLEQVAFSYVLGLTVGSESPETAYRVATTIADDYLETQRKTRLEQMQRLADWLRSQLDNLGSRVATTEAAIEKLKAEGGFTNAGTHGTLSEQRIADLNSQLLAARADLVAKRAAFDQAQRVLKSHGDVTDIPEVMASSFVAQLRQQRSDLIRQQANVRAVLGGQGAGGILSTKLASLDAAINAEVSHTVDSMKNAYQAAAQREQSLQESLQRLINMAGNSSAYIKLQQLERVRNADRQLYESYLAQFNEITTRQSFADAGPQIISPAMLPTAPSKPRRILFYGFGGVFGLGLGLGLAVFLEYFRPRVKTGADIEKTFGYPVLGVIPLVMPGRRRDRVEPDSLMRAIVDVPLSQVGESVRAMRIRLGLSSTDRAAKVILVTSSVLGEGKSATAMLLAASSATAGQSAVLVDCDMRHCTVSQALGMPKHGLADLLAGTAGIDVDDVIIPAPAAQPHVIPAGSTTRSPADLLASPRLYELIARLRERYDFIVLDAAPVLAVIDVLTLVAVADQIILIVEWNRTPRTLIAETFKLLKRDANRIAGVVLNKVDLKQVQTYDYAYAYTYPYGAVATTVANGAGARNRTRRLAHG
jgi:polysaccharide biosynthesis transport protein